jgi:catechol 2,3-dioxygenase-like lactoylglutathione lyase family enzyme
MSLVDVKGVQHVGIPVSDLKRSLEWYEKVLGIVEEFRVDGSGPGVSELLQVENADLTAVFLRVGDMFVELLEHKTPGRPFDRKNNDVGALHLCFRVDDINAAYDALKQAGVSVNSEPVYNDDGPLKGVSIIYFRDPDGIQLEFFSNADHL